MESGTNRFIYGAAFIMLALLMLIFQSAYASEITGYTISTQEANISAGTTPDSILYFFDVFFDNVNLALTADQAEKSKKALNIARERLMEVKKMAEENKMDAAEVARREHANALGVVKDTVSKVEIENSTREIETEIEIEKEFNDHENEIRTVNAELKFKMIAEKDLTQKERDALISVSSGLENRTGELEIEIEKERNETRIKIRQRTNRSEEEIEREIEDIEIRSELSRRNATGGIDDDASETSRETEIEVDIEDGTSEVKIKTDSVRKRLVLDTADRERIIARIMTETGLTRDEILSSLKFKTGNETSEDVQERERELEIERERNQTEIRRENETEIEKETEVERRRANETEIRSEDRRENETEIERGRESERQGANETESGDDRTGSSVRESSSSDAGESESESSGGEDDSLSGDSSSSNGESSSSSSGSSSGEGSSSSSSSGGESSSGDGNGEGKY